MIARPVAVASAGIAMVGVSFGMARYGFGLLAPDIRATFRLSSAAVGLLSAASYVAYIAASLVAAVGVARLGPRAVVAAGGVLAVVGMLVAAGAPSAGVLFAGLLVAGASAGLAFPPFTDVAGPRVLAAVNAGTGWGVALAAPIALLAGAGWRVAWLAFALVAVAATLWAAIVLPARSSASARAPSARAIVTAPGAPRLLGASLVIGLASSVFWTFAVDHVRAEGLTSTEGRLFLVVVGLASILGTATAPLVERFGARATYFGAAGSEAAALVLVGLAGASLPAAFAAAVLFGVAYNTIVGVTVLGSAQVHAGSRSAGLAALMSVQAVGLLAGPPVLGALADATSFAVAFCGAAALLALAAAVSPARSSAGGASGPTRA